HHQADRPRRPAHRLVPGALALPGPARARAAGAPRSQRPGPPQPGAPQGGRAARRGARMRGFPLLAAALVACALLAGCSGSASSAVRFVPDAGTQVDGARAWQPRLAAALGPPATSGLPAWTPQFDAPAKAYD